MQKFHIVEDIKFTDDKITMKIDKKQHTFKISEISTRLQKASKKERETFEISASGYGIHWPLIDEDLSIDGLLGVAHKPIWQEKIKTLS